MGNPQRRKDEIIEKGIEQDYRCCCESDSCQWFPNKLLKNGKSCPMVGRTAQNSPCAGCTVSVSIASFFNTSKKKEKCVQYKHNTRLSNAKCKPTTNKDD